MEPIESQPPAAPSPFDLGTWAGESRALHSVSRHCTAAGAERLKRIRESCAYETLNLNWEEFCRDHLGISRSYADKLIRRFDEFGAHYFEFAGLVPVTPENYRQIAPAITEEGIEIEGEIVPITPENAPRIRREVAALRAKVKNNLRPDPSITTLVMRFDNWFDDFSRILNRAPLFDPTTQASIAGLTQYAFNKLKRVA
jgi:hypothetical protein